MSQERCEVTDLPKNQCAHCRSKPRSYAWPPGAWFLARYSGECAGCGDEIQPGDSIRPDGEGVGGYFCKDCGREDDEFEWKPIKEGY